MLSFIRCVLIALPLFWVPSDSAEVCCFLTPGSAIDMSCLLVTLFTRYHNSTATFGDKLSTVYACQLRTGGGSTYRPDRR